MLNALSGSGGVSADRKVLGRISRALSSLFRAIRDNQMTMSSQDLPVDFVWLDFIQEFIIHVKIIEKHLENPSIRLPKRHYDDTRSPNSVRFSAGRELSSGKDGVGPGIRF
jgi:hypothetical protein